MEGLTNRQGRLASLSHRSSKPVSVVQKLFNAEQRHVSLFEVSIKLIAGNNIKSTKSNLLNSQSSLSARKSEIGMHCSSMFLRGLIGRWPSEKSQSALILNEELF